MLMFSGYPTASQAVPNEAILRVGPLTVNLDRRQATVDGRLLMLTPKEYAVLEVLVLGRGAVLSKAVLMERLYIGGDEPEAKIIDIFICKLRKKLAQAGADNLIGTMWGRGYMMRDAGSAALT